MTKTLHGKVHGRTIELDDDLGVPEGQEVQVMVLHSQKMWGDGLKRCAEALADIPNLKEDMNQILEERKADRFREVPK